MALGGGGEIKIIIIIIISEYTLTSLAVYWSEVLTTNHEVPGLIPGSTMGIFLVGGGSPW